MHHPQTEALLCSMKPDTLTTRRDWRTAVYRQPARRGMADLRQRLAVRHETGDTPLVDFTRDRLHRETLRTSAVMNSPPLTPLPGSYRASSEQPAV